MTMLWAPRVRRGLVVAFALASGVFGAGLVAAVSLNDAALNQVRFYESKLTYTDGAVLATTPTADEGACRTKCAGDKACRSYVWNTVSHACEMKSGTSPITAYVDRFNSGVKAPFGSGPATNQFDVRNYSYTVGTVLKTTPMPNVDRMDYGPCRDLCAADATCKSFVWNNIDMKCEAKSGESFAPGTVDYFFAGVKRSVTTIPNVWIEYQCDILPLSNKANCRYEMGASTTELDQIKNVTLHTGQGLLWDLGGNMEHLQAQRKRAGSLPTFTLAWDQSVIPARRAKEVWAEVETATSNKFIVPMRSGATYPYPQPSAADLARPNPVCESSLSWGNTPTEGAISQHFEIARTARDFYWHMKVSAGPYGGYLGLQQRSDGILDASTQTVDKANGAIDRVVFSFWGANDFQRIVPAVGLDCVFEAEMEGPTPGIRCFYNRTLGKAVGQHDLKMTQYYDLVQNKIWITGHVDGLDIVSIGVDPPGGKQKVALAHEYSAAEYFGGDLPRPQTVVTWDAPSNATDKKQQTALFRYDCPSAMQP